MKFAEHLAAHITPEWRKQYIQYEAMKDMLYETKELAPSDEMADQEFIERHFATFDEIFFVFCDKELLKINTFFSEKLSEASRKYSTLDSELSASQQAAEYRGASTSKLPPKGGAVRRRSSVTAALLKDRESRNNPLSTRKIHDIKLAFSEFYLSLILLQNYQTLNFTGFRKILKKHDKLLDTERGTKWRQLHVETATFYTSKTVDLLIKKTEEVFTQRLEGGDRQKAMKRLRVPPLGEQQNPWTTFRVGLFAGIFVALAIVAMVASFSITGHGNWVPALTMYRAIFLVILHCLLLGINTYGWRSSGVNHVLIFELDPRDHLTHQQLLEIAGMFSVIWAVSLLCYLFSNYIHIPEFASPLSLIGFCFLFLINPFHVCHHKARRWLLRILFRIVTAPFHHVGFADFWLADQLNSLGTVLLDLEFMICFYALEVPWHGGEKTDSVCGGVSYGIRPIVACLPAWFRFAQCLRRFRDTRLVFPHIVNAGKYSTTFFVVLFASLNTAYKSEHGDEVIQQNAFFYLWIMSAIISSCYTLTWDLKMDWGLLDKNAGENKLLREEIVYAYGGYYYFAMIEDFLIRFSWIIVVTVGEGNYLHKEILKSILSSLEVFRRFIWNFFRLENEHLNNCGQFRAVRDISIAPIDSNDRQILDKMMNEPDGVVNRQQGSKQKTMPGSR